ncbi:hypothetical protein CDL12_05105 [Handroanthus impetiginosus]|uniref:Transmembrane protein n=1 Tax=Handroanthus impetiginosus TaxID=429701 RepID=A0A2G9HXE7_9LAMI|nr:hypothetical protein CDL12_05105 [Handroanthus impetiginosus]
MARFLLLYIVLFISLAKSNESRAIIQSNPPTAVAPANAGESFSLVSGLAPSSGGSDRNGTLGLDDIWKHHGDDKSAAGGDVIVGGFAAALVAAIVCYIRITRRSKDSHSDNVL